ncbi:MAG: hypothetical protein ACREIB_14220, partial [Pseudomonadota bacterium]
IRVTAVRNSGRVAKAAVETLLAVRAAPSVAARVGVALLVVAGVAALLARSRRQGGALGYRVAARGSIMGVGGTNDA